MSTYKTSHARIQLKNDTEENWNKAVNFVPLNGEVIIYDTDDTHPNPRIKVGDGIKTVNELPFTGSYNYSVENKILTLG